MPSVALRVSCLSPVLRLTCFGGGGAVPFPPYMAWGCALPVGRVCASGAFQRQAGWGGGGGRPVRRAPRLRGGGGQWGGGSPCLGPSLCLPWAGNKAGVLGVALTMEGLAPIPLWFVFACCLRAPSVWRPGVLARVRLLVVVPAGKGGQGVEAGPAPASLSGDAVLPGGGGIIPAASGGVGAGAPVARGPGGGGWGDRGGGHALAPLLSLWGGRPAASYPARLLSPAYSPLAYAFGWGRGAAQCAACGLPPGGQPGGGGGEGRPVNRLPGGPNRPGLFLCPPWAGNIAGVIGDALVMGGAAPILFRFVVACRPRAWPVRHYGALVRAPPPVATPTGAGGGGRGGARRADPSASPAGRHGPFWGRGDVPSAPGGGRTAGAPEARRPGGERGGERGGGGPVPLLPAPLPFWVARGPRPCHPSSPARPPGLYTCNQGCRAAVGAGRGPVGRRWVRVAGGGGEVSPPRSSPPPSPGWHQCGPLRVRIPGPRRSVTGRQRVMWE